jgi:hypothetical protein
MLSEVFYSLVLSTGSALVLACIGISYKSKCKNIKLCGGIVEIERDVEIEYKEDEINNNNNDKV